MILLLSSKAEQYEISRDLFLVATYVRTIRRKGRDWNKGGDGYNTYSLKQKKNYKQLQDTKGNITLQEQWSCEIGRGGSLGKLLRKWPCHNKLCRSWYQVEKQEIQISHLLHGIAIPIDWILRQIILKSFFKTLYNQEKVEKSLFVNKNFVIL